eukprot:CAMPEP_0201209050 /NCGR_PEP_ID=MMETSP0851-20130426/177531_1 /ASSEMBLY_ACC=CAM_ASM_000631 /TAXON_ID=183588 /ORGANISM="Pseudo-nitzschia fraudulenta, Strain WWA7" /LENGTH=77 /DNA_ID=CAMNT_0047497673 /DNA_START=21 /DNA_END=251 /DNA_ORIENTATION=+
MNTRQESNTNQPSFRPSRFLLKDMKRAVHSKEKKMQKKCSAIWNTGLAASKSAAELLSVSMAIHKALKLITPSVIFS